MNTGAKTFRITGLVASALLAAGLLAGCANPFDQLAQSGIENMIKDQIKEQTGVDIDVNLTGGELPASWPATVPTPNGLPHTFAMGASDTGWTANYEAPNKSVWEDYVKTLEAAGFTLNHTTDLAGLSGAVLGNDSYNLLVNYSGNDGSASLTVIVTLAN